MITHGVPFADYLTIDAISAHGLMQIERSPLHFWHGRQTPRAPTPAQALGTLTHLAILEWDRYQDAVVVAPDVDRRTKAGREAYKDFEDTLRFDPDAIGATAEQDARARAMREAVMAQPFARALLADGAAEVTLQWDLDGTACKARPDWVCGGHEVVVDVKTAREADPTGFAKAAGAYTYHLQAAHYIDAAEQCGLGQRAFVFVAIETDPPYAVGLYQLDEEALRVGRIRRDRALDTYRDCLASGQWPGYATDILTLSLPKWAL